MFTGFEEADFDVFSIEGLEPRMNAIKERIRPKLEELGRQFTAFLTPLAGDEMFAHVAKHARRTVNPPNDTWVAFSANARGYKQHPHFQIGLWRSHAFVTFGYIYEATGKAAYGSYLEREAGDLAREIPADFVYIPDHMNPECVSAAEVDAEQIRAYGQRLQNLKGAELLIGRRLLRDEVIALSGDAFCDTVEKTFTTLAPLYRAVQHVHK